MKKVLIIILSLICFNLFGCSVITATDNNNNKKGSSTDTTTVDIITTTEEEITTTTQEEITTTTEEESKVYDLVKDLNKYDLKEGDVFYNEDLTYYICDKKTGDIVESYDIKYKNNRLIDTLYSYYEYDSELEKTVFKNEFCHNVIFSNGGTPIGTFVHNDDEMYDTYLYLKNKYEIYDENKFLYFYSGSSPRILEIISIADFIAYLYINNKLQSNINYEFFTIEETKDKIIVQYRELNSRLIHKEYNTNDYYLDIVNNIDNKPYIYLTW